MTISDAQFRRMQRQTRRAWILMGVALCVALYWAVDQRNAQIERVAESASTITLARCEQVNRVAKVTRSALLAQRALLLRKYQRGEYDSEQDYILARSALGVAIGKLAPADCEAEADAILHAAD